MTDKDEIKFAIRYLKQGLKSKRTPPLYEELMKELGFVKKDKVQKLEKENAELKDYRLKTRLKEQTEMSKYALNLEHKLSWYDTKLTKAKEIIKEFMRISTASVEEYEPEFTELIGKAEQFITEFEK